MQYHRLVHRDGVLRVGLWSAICTLRSGRLGYVHRRSLIFTRLISTALSSALSQVAAIILGCTALLIASYMEVVAFLPWTTAAFYVYPWIDLPLRISRAVAAVFEHVGPTIKSASVQAKPLLASLWTSLKRGAELMRPVLVSTEERLVTALAPHLADSVFKGMERLVVAAIVTVVLLLLLALLRRCCIRKHNPQLSPHRGFRVRALD